MKDNSNLKKVHGKAAKKRKHFIPEKPYPEYPLTPHSAGVWMKKIRGEIHYFGRWGRTHNGKMELLPDDTWWQDALAIYKAQTDDLHAGRTLRVMGWSSTLLLLRKQKREIALARYRLHPHRIARPNGGDLGAAWAAGP